MVRRVLDKIWATKDSSIIFAALDWSKAFDSISPSALGDALRRFGIPDKFIKVVSSIYSGRQFIVSDFGKTSVPRD